MAQYFDHSIRNNIKPLDASNDRDEYYLIDVLGTWIPECELIFYGLLGSEHEKSLIKLREWSNFNARDVYLDLSYFTSRDLIRYLTSPDDTLEDLSDEEISTYLTYAFNHYMYMPCSETALRHSLMETLNFDFAKSLTLVYPWDVRDIDIKYLQSITPQSMMKKINIASGSIPEVIKETGETYTTIVSNSIDDINLLVDNKEEYKTDATLFLLRNHSENMVMDKDEEGKVVFLEAYMEGLLDKLIDMQTGLPKTQIRFGRFEPKLFSDMSSRISDFTNH